VTRLRSPGMPADWQWSWSGPRCSLQTRKWPQRVVCKGNQVAGKNDSKLRPPGFDQALTRNNQHWQVLINEALGGPCGTTFATGCARLHDVARFCDAEARARLRAAIETVREAKHFASWMGACRGSQGRQYLTTAAAARRAIARCDVSSIRR
jgi:hypothetical protein